jgi:hypothetical protein
MCNLLNIFLLKLAAAVILCISAYDNHLKLRWIVTLTIILLSITTIAQRNFPFFKEAISASQSFFS